MSLTLRFKKKTSIQFQADDIWIPKVKYVDADFKDLHMSDPSVSASRFSKPILDDISRVISGMLLVFLNKLKSTKEFTTFFLLS